jgi:uncharacterized membrane protein YgcG
MINEKKKITTAHTSSARICNLRLRRACAAAPILYGAPCTLDPATLPGHGVEGGYCGGGEDSGGGPSGEYIAGGRDGSYGGGGLCGTVGDHGDDGAGGLMLAPKWEGGEY